MDSSNFEWIRVINEAIGLSLVFFTLRGRYTLKYYLQVFCPILILVLSYILLSIPFEYQLPLIAVTCTLFLYHFASESIKNTFITFAATMAILLFGNFLVEILDLTLTNIISNTFFRIIVRSNIALLPMLFLCFFIHKLLDRLKVYNTSSKRINSWWSIIMFFLLSLFIISMFALRLIQSIPDGRVFNILIFLVMAFIISGIVAFLLIINWQVEKKNIELAHQQNIIAQTIQYTETIESMIDDIRSYRHDFKNLLLALEGYIKEGNLEQIKEFYDLHLTDMESKKDISFSQIYQLQNITDAAVKGLLYIKLQYALAEGFKIQVNVSGPIMIEHIPAMDFCRILGILLDNAIEAAVAASSEGNPRELFFYTEQQGSNTMIVISNTHPRRLQVEDLYQDGFTTKGKGRGTGLKTVRTLLRQYPNISLDWKIDNYVHCFLTLDSNVKQQLSV